MSDRASLERSADIMLRLSEDVRAATAEGARKREQDERIVRAVEDQQGDLKHVMRNIEGISRSVSDIAEELAAYLPQLNVVTQIAAEHAKNASAKAGVAANEAGKAANEAEKTHSKVDHIKDKTDKFPLVDPKGQATHFLDRFDRVGTRTWLFSFGGLLLIIIILCLALFLDLSIKKKQEAPHPRDNRPEGASNK